MSIIIGVLDARNHRLLGADSLSKLLLGQARFFSSLIHLHRNVSVERFVLDCLGKIGVGSDFRLNDICKIPCASHLHTSHSAVYRSRSRMTKRFRLSASSMSPLGTVRSF